MFDLGNDFHRGHANKLSASRRMVNAAAPRRSVPFAVGSWQSSAFATPAMPAVPARDIGNKPSAASP